MKEIEEGLEFAFGEEVPRADTKKELADVYYPFEQKVVIPKNGKKTKKRLVDALSDGLKAKSREIPQPCTYGPGCG